MMTQNQVHQETSRYRDYLTFGICQRDDETALRAVTRLDSWKRAVDYANRIMYCELVLS